MLPDRWNPRVRLRDWLLKPTAAEKAQGRALAILAQLTSGLRPSADR